MDQAVRSFAAFVIAQGKAVIVADDGEVTEPANVQEASAALMKRPHLICHTDFVMGRMGLAPQEGARLGTLDLLELFAFVRPAQSLVPTPDGLATALGLAPPADPEDEAVTLLAARDHLLNDLTLLDGEAQEDARRTGKIMADAGWVWGGDVMAALGGLPQRPGGAVAGLDAWNRLKDNDEAAPPPAPGQERIDPDEAVGRLHQLTGNMAEDRPGQQLYAKEATHVFRPRMEDMAPHVMMAEAGTGTGKTFGYLAPASLWAETNKAPVWISTYTKNLQSQIDDELDRLFPDPKVKAARSVVRKGRENYLCLLNYEDRVKRVMGLGGAHAARSGPARSSLGPIALGLVQRWILASRDGDMVGGDFPGWLTHLFGGGAQGSGSAAAATGLTDRRGECIHSGCPHHRKCFVEKVVGKSKHADIVIANHALVLIQAAMGQIDIDPGNSGPARLPSRYVLDEGHHLFEAADSAFAADLTVLETMEMRRWLIGADGAGQSRARGLDRRVRELISPDKQGDEGREALRDIGRMARELPGGEAMMRLRAENSDHGPTGPAEQFLALVRKQVIARNQTNPSQYSLETPVTELIDGLAEAGAKLAKAIDRLTAPMKQLAVNLEARLSEEAEDLDTPTRLAIEAALRGIRLRALMTLPAWASMTRTLNSPAPDGLVDWFGLERSYRGRAGLVEMDVGMHRHYLDPTEPLAEVLLNRADGTLITSATLRDKEIEDEAEADLRDWRSAEVRTGARHLVEPAKSLWVPSPFDYPNQTRVLIINDVNKNSADQTAAAIKALITASGGGTLALFTAIRRLRDVYERIGGPLNEAGLDLYAQHVDRVDNATLVDLFRSRRDASLLGTDAMRDGIDVPGASLRTLIFDRVPWPRPDILHKARREVFGGKLYDDMLVRLKLAQAYGRLVRKQGDRGLFIMMDGACPTRLTTAFPDDVAVDRLGLAEAVEITRSFHHD